MCFSKLKVNLNLKCKGVRVGRFGLDLSCGRVQGGLVGSLVHIRTIGDPAPFLLCLVSEDLNFVKRKGI